MQIRSHSRGEGGGAFCATLFGATKVGKTTFAVSCAPAGGKVLLVAFADGYKYAPDCDLAVVEDWADVPKLAKAVENYDTIVLDEGASMVDLAMAAVCKKYRVGHPAESRDESSAIWNHMKVEVERAILAFKRSGANIIVTAHAHPQKVAVTEQIEEIRQVPDISAGVRKKLSGHSDFVMYMAARGGQRVIDLEPRKGVDAGSRVKLYDDNRIKCGSTEDDTIAAAQDFFARATGQKVGA